MRPKNLLFNSITLSLPKNFVQFSLGVLLYWITFGLPYVYTTLLSLLAFLLAYSSVYIYNDIVDFEEDRKDPEKSKWKLIAGGMISMRTGKILGLSLLVSGLTLSLYVNKWFFLIILAMLFLNFLHSSPYTRFKVKMKRTAINMTVIEFLKYSSGWFALTSDITKFPFWLILTFSVVYSISYLIYKFKFKGEIIKSNKKLFASMGLVGLISYIISFFSYDFQIPIIILLVFPALVLFLFRQADIDFHRINNMILIEYMLLPVVILSFVLLTVPVIGQANEKIAMTIDQQTAMITENMPSYVLKPIENITQGVEKYKTLDDLEKEIKNNIEDVMTAFKN